MSQVPPRASCMPPCAKYSKNATHHLLLEVRGKNFQSHVFRNTLRTFRITFKCQMTVVNQQVSSRKSIDFKFILVNLLCPRATNEAPMKGLVLNPLIGYGWMGSYLVWNSRVKQKLDQMGFIHQPARILKIITDDIKHLQQSRHHFAVSYIWFRRGIMQKKDGIYNSSVWLHEFQIHS